MLLPPESADARAKAVHRVDNEQCHSATAVVTIASCSTT